MKFHADFAVTVTGGTIVLVGYSLWQIHQGTDRDIVLAGGFLTLVTVAGTTALTWDRWKRRWARQTEEPRRGFPWRGFASGNAVALAFVLFFALTGWDRASLELGAALLFGIGNTGGVVQWIIERRIARHATPDDAGWRRPS